MKKFSFGVLAALLVVGGAACSSSGGGGGTTPTDGGTNHDSGNSTTDSGIIVVTDSGNPNDDTGGPATDSGTPGGDTGTGSETGPAGDNGKTGQACTTDTDCGAGSNDHCSNTFTGNAGFTGSYCIQGPTTSTCVPDSTGATVVTCDQDNGICQALASGKSACLPGCTFTTAGNAAPAGCLGKDLCQPLSLSSDGTSGIGECTGGCVADGDCPTGDVCQTEFMSCTAPADKTTFTKTVGAACTSADDATGCPCLRNQQVATSAGYCTKVCKVGDTSTCPAKFVCSTLIAKTDLPKESPGMAGNCVKSCTSQADCLSTETCDTTLATGSVCLPK